METSTCRHCGRTISHGGSKTLAEADAPWFGNDDDFLCPDGEQVHQPKLTRVKATDVYPSLRKATDPSPRIQDTRVPPTAEDIADAQADGRDARWMREHPEGL